MDTVPGRHLMRLFEATRNINAEIVPKETIRIVIQETIKLLKCDRVSLFVYDKRIEMLVLNASNLEFPIRVSPGQGIAGFVFAQHKTVNIPDCYEDERFDPAFDKQSGYRTRSMLTVPIMDFENQSMGVLQAINKDGDSEFDHIDELLMGHLTQHVGIALRNAEVYRDAIITSERANGLLHMISSLSQDLGTQSTILTITMHANQLIQADRCTVFLVDDAKQELWSVSTDSGKEIRIPKSAGIAGQCATEGKIINIPDAYKDPRFNQEIDKKTGYKTQSMLVIPVRNEQQSRILAVIQMINKTEFDGVIGQFDEDDVTVMDTFAKYVGSKLSNASFLAASNEVKKSEGASAFGSSMPKKGLGGDGKPNALGSSNSFRGNNGKMDTGIIEEGDEEDG